MGFRRWQWVSMDTSRVESHMALQCLGSRTKHSSKQCTMRNRELEKDLEGTTTVLSNRKKSARAMIWGVSSPCGCRACQSYDFERNVRETARVRCFRMLSNTKKLARAAASSSEWLRSTPEPSSRAPSGCRTRPSSEF